MRLQNLLKFTLTTLLAATLLQSCKDDVYLNNPIPSPDASFNEEFDSVPAALNRGWKIVNTTFPYGSGIWQSGGELLNPIFNAFSQNGSNAGFIGVSYKSTNALKSSMSNWLISPSVLIKNGDIISFYTRAQTLAIPPVAGSPGNDTTDFANRLQVRIYPYGDDLLTGNQESMYATFVDPNVGGEDNPGNYTISLLDINPFQYEWHKKSALGQTVQSLIDPLRFFTAYTNNLAYPVRWTKFTVTVSGLNKPTKSRFAFRYFILGAGNDGYGTAIGIDKVEFKSATN